MYSIGLDIGYSTAKLTIIDSNHTLMASNYKFHKGNIKKTLLDMLETLPQSIKDKIAYGGITGSAGKKLSDLDHIHFINEATALVEGAKVIAPKAASILEIGGESSKFISHYKKTSNQSIHIAMNSNCAAGTGSYLEEQMSRLNLQLEDYSKLANKAQSIPRIAGRCSVFAKTDITHHQQEGTTTEDILLGLAYAVVRNYKATVIKKSPIIKPVLFTGGVTFNDGIITALKDVLKLKAEDLIIPEHSASVAALGAAILALNDGHKFKLNQLKACIKSYGEGQIERPYKSELKPLANFGQDQVHLKHLALTPLVSLKKTPCYLGVDVGSTSTNFVLMDGQNEILCHDYSRTLGQPINAVKRGLKKLKEFYGDYVEIIGVGVTGSGRYMIGDLIGADLIKDEITAQAKAATTIDPHVDTIFEIGGQDSKYIQLRDGAVIDFQMNKICAAGTGSFIEEQAKKFDIEIEEFGPLALKSQNVIGLGERCTVFMETCIAANLSKGEKMEDIASGLCYAIAQNYLSRVVGQKKIGEKIFFQGGVAYNQGVINAFKALTGKEIAVPPFFSVTGAYGAALLTKEEAKYEMTAFKGFDVEDKDTFIQRKTLEKQKKHKFSSFNEKNQALLFKDYQGHIDPNKKTVGIPRALFSFGLYAMFSGVFEALGYNVILSDPTSESTLERGQKYTLDEACYPMKIIMGHVAELIEKKVNYIFFLDLHSVDHPSSKSRANYGCAYMQMAFKLIKHSMDLEEHGIKLLGPTMSFKMGQAFDMKSIIEMGRILNRSDLEMTHAYKAGQAKAKRFKDQLGENRKKELEQLEDDQTTFVLISKVYGVADPLLNMGIPDRLTEMGYRVISFYDLPESDLSHDHDNMFWPFGQHILKPTSYIKSKTNLHPILLTHHGCGPDTILSHYFKEEMGDRPYLHIEVDEHASSVGVITRVEAFVNSLKHGKNIKTVKESDRLIEPYISGLQNMSQDQTILIPNLPPYSEIFKSLLRRKGIQVNIMAQTTHARIRRGRKYSISEEYFSLTALLGDVFSELDQYKNDKAIYFYLPQYEGTEADGQYPRLLKTKLREEAYTNVKVISPFIEDALLREKKDVELICYGLIAGDIIKNAAPKSRERYLKLVTDFIREEDLTIEFLAEIAKNITKELHSTRFCKKLLAVGEKTILYNNHLNNHTFKRLEEEGHKVVYASLSEALALLWYDFAQQENFELTHKFNIRLELFLRHIAGIHKIMKKHSPFTNDFMQLVESANKSVGLYAGGFGRYRQAKTHSINKHIDGIITVSSMYENTGILLNALHRSKENSLVKPLLNLTFDGNDNDQDRMKLESFMYYL